MGALLSRLATRLREYPSATFRDVTAPNADTLYTSAFLDVGKEPIPRLAGRTDALFIAFNASMVANRTKIATLALANQLPTSCPIRDFVVAGGLQSFGFSLPNEFRRAAPFVDKILKGARPADLPIEQPTTFEMVINLKTAKSLGLSVPAQLLARADEVIE